MSPEISGVIRHVLTFVGGILVTTGYLDQGTATQLTGALMTIIGIVWSIKEKTK